MRVRDSEKVVGMILSIDNDVLRACGLISITNNNGSNLICSGKRKVIAISITCFIKIK